MDNRKSHDNTISPTDSRVVVRVDVDGKNWHTFSNGVIIRHERAWNNLDRKHTIQTLGTVVKGGGMPVGAKVLLHHNAIHDVARIFNYKHLSGGDIASQIGYFSIPETQCYLWQHNSSEWHPLRGFVTGLRVFEPIETKFYGIAPTLIKNTLYITSGDLAGKVVRTVKAADYVIKFLDSNGQENEILRCRHFPNEINEREEITAVDHNYTEKAKKGELYVGLTQRDAHAIGQKEN